MTEDKPITLDEAAERIVETLGWVNDGTAEPEDIQRAFKAGAEWQSQQPKVTERPEIKDFFGPDINVLILNDIFLANPELYMYISALDSYIDKLESQQTKPTGLKCDECNGQGKVEKNIHRGEEGMQIEMDVEIVCSECNGTGLIEQEAPLPKPTGLRWVKASERLPDENYSFGEDEFGNFPVRFWFEYRIVLGIGYLNKEVKEIYNSMNCEPFTDENLEWLESGETEETKPVEDKFLKELLKISDSLYNNLPTGTVHALDLIRLINTHLNELNEFIENYQTPKPVSEEGWEQKFYNNLKSLYDNYNEEWAVWDQNLIADLLHDYDVRNIP